MNSQTDPKPAGNCQRNTRSVFSRKGIGTLEVVIIIAVLLSVALIFRAALTTYASQLIESVFGSQSAISDLIVPAGTADGAETQP